MAIINVLIFVALYILISNLICLIKVLKKKHQIVNSNSKYLSLSKRKYLNSYLDKIENKLFNLGFPYKLNLKKYLIIKYGLSIVVFLIAFLNYKTLKIPILLYFVIFFTPNYLIYNYKNKEKSLLINELKNITNNLILYLSSYTSLKDSLNQIQSTIKNKRLYSAYEIFLKEYNMNGYKLNKPAKNLESKFESYELSLFLGTLIQGDKEGNILDAILKYKETLELNYFKYLKKQTATRLMYVTFGTILSLINIVLIVMYPILMQVMDSLQIIFS